MTLSFRLTGTPGQIMDALAERYGGEDVWNNVLRAQANGVIWSKRQIWFYQAAALAVLARQYDREGAVLLDFGTAFGFTATLLGQSAPRARVVTLNPKAREYDSAWVLDYCRNVTALQVSSQEYLEECRTEGRTFDLVFVDGDHREAAIRSDLGYWETLREGGLILFHDYSPPDSARPGGDVYPVVTAFGEGLGREADVLIIDHRGVGMAGWVK